MLTAILIFAACLALAVVGRRVLRAPAPVAAPIDATPPEPVDVARIPAAARAQRRDAFIPQVAEGDAPGASGFAVVPALRAGEAIAAAPPVPAGMFPPRRITGWARVDDYPDAEELESMGATLEVPTWEAYDGQDLPRGGDKLLGWPAWVQGVDYASCPRCGTRMEQLVQLTSEGNLPWRIGDMGTCHVLQCPAHHDALSFTWAGS